MPIYTYRCENCGVRFERYQKFEDQTLTWCPECNKKTLLKVFQPVGIVFKGSGFYSTDHRSPSGQSWSSQQNAEKAERANETKSEPKAESKTETKTETKAEAKPEAKPVENPTPAPKTEKKSE
jgi:putative FmdB family regulatory protein